MSDLLPIEKGCKAIIIGSFFPENNGLEVVVGNFLGGPGDYEDEVNDILWIERMKDYWEIDIDKVSGDMENRYYESIIPESMLMRIDGHKEDELDQVKELAK